MRNLVLRLFVCVLFLQVAMAARADWFPNPDAGTFRVEYDLYPVYQSDTSVTIKVLRENGTDGAVSVYFETLDSGAQMWTDYVGQWGRLDWDNGDNTPKTININLLNTGLTTDKNFIVQLYTPTDGASISTANRTAKVQISSTNHNRLPSYILKRQFPTIGFINGLLIEGAYHGVSGIGDIDGDGQEDIAVGAYIDRALGTCAEGALYVLSHLTKINQASVNVDSDPSSSKVSGTDFFSLFGDLVSGVGDVNGDGYNDFVVGASKAVFPDESDGGKFYLIYGSANGVTSGTISNLLANYKAVEIVRQAYEVDGEEILAEEIDGELHAVTSVGDINNDGYDDYVLTQRETPGNMNSSLVYGSPYYVGLISLTEIDPSSRLSFGSLDVKSAGDYNGDGISDLSVYTKTITNPEDPEWDIKNYILSGGVPLQYEDGSILLEQTSDYYFLNDGPFKTVGDINADGYSDLAGYYLQNASTSRIVIRLGNSGGGIPPNSPFSPKITITWPGIINELNPVGDLNGDGYMDFGIRGETKEFGNGNLIASHDGGYVAIIYGSATGVGVNFFPDSNGNIDFTNKIDGINALIIEDSIDTQRSKFSNSFKHAGDINQDGISDLLIGYGVQTGGAFGHCLVGPGNSYVIHGKGGAQSAKYSTFLPAGNSRYRGVGMVQDGSHSTPFSRVWINHKGGSVSKEEVTLFRNKSSFTNCPADTLNVGWKIKSNRTGQASTKVRFKYLDSEILSTENSLTVLTAPTLSGPWVRADKISHNLIKNEITIELASLPSGYQYYILAPLGSVYEKGSLVVLDQEVSIPAINVNSYNFASCSLSSDSLQTISSHVHVKQSQRSGASGSVKSSRNLWNLGSELCPTVSSVCGDSQYTSYSLTNLASHSFNLSGVANPWSSSGCSSVVSPNSELNFPLTLMQLDAQTTVSVVGPQTWSSISSFPTSASHSPVTINVNIGPGNIVIREVALTIYNKANPIQRRTLKGTVQNNSFVWNGIVYNQPLPESPEVSGFYLAPSANVGMSLTVKVADTFTNATTYSVDKQFSWNYDAWSAGPYVGTGYQLYTPLE